MSHELLQSGPAGDDPASRIDRDQRLQMSRRAIWVAAAVVTFYIPFDLFASGYLIHAVVEGLSLAMLLSAARLLRNPKRLETAQLIATVAVAMSIAVVILTGTARDGVLVWLALFPPAPFYLGGLRSGVKLTAVFGAILLPALSIAILLDAPVGLSWIAVFNAGGALLCSAAIAYIYEHSRMEAQQRLSALASSDPMTGVANRRGFLLGYESLSPRLTWPH